jgi:solute carrier family 34 (sodium-dependent phosphate cotransporter)
MFNNIYIKIIAVFICLYIFLVGISALSKSISGLTSPNEISIGDMAQLKKVKFNELEKKKIWVKILTVNKDESFEFEYVYNEDGIDDKVCADLNGSLIEDSCIIKGKTDKKNIKKIASSSFITATDSAFISLFIGIFATVIFQSSSTTTSLIVGMAGSGLVALSSAVPMVMGANIGTTVTNTIVSLGHLRQKEEFKRAFASSTVHDFFNILAVLIFFPLEMMFGILEKSATFLGNFFFTEISEKPFESPIKAAVKWAVNHLKDFVHNIIDSDWALLAASVIITLIMLYSIVKLLRSMVLAKVEKFFDDYIFKTAMRAILFGFLLTVMVQSSSITTSAIIPLAGAGVLTLRQIFPFTLGANIGTTVTSIMAALVLNPLAMVVAFSHLLFNILGIITIYPIKKIREIPLYCAETLAELSLKNRLIPLIYLGIVFVLTPLIIILIGG